MNLIQIEKLSFTYPGGRRVLDSLDFRLDAGEKIGLIGPNGSGKTTLFHVIMGLLRPDTGTIRIFGQEMREEKDFRPVRRRVGLLFQDADDQLFSPTVLEDVAFGPLNQGKTPGEAREIAREILLSLGLEGFEDRVTHKLSGGEKKLASLATVLAMKPEALLLDEPTAGLDFETTERIVHVLSETGIACVVISHDMDYLERTTHRICTMDRGRILSGDGRVMHAHAHAHEKGWVPHSHTLGTPEPQESGKGGR